MNLKNNLVKNLFSIKNKTCVITGGAGGIGSILSKLLSLNGANVIILDKNINKNYSKKLKYYQCDLQNKNKTKLIIKEIINKYRKIDCLLNCLGISDEKTFINNININLISIYNLTKIILENMKKKGGSIINITSLNAELGFSNNPGYVSSKGALKMLTKSFALDYAKYNIRVNNIGPGYIKTRMTQKKYKNLRQRKIRLDRIPMARYGNPEELFGAVVFLMTDASSYVTGQDFYIDGGFLAKGI